MTALTDEAFLESLCDEVDGVYHKYRDGGVACEPGVRAALQQTRSVLSALRPRAAGPAAALRATVAVAQVNDLLCPKASSGTGSAIASTGAPSLVAPPAVAPPAVGPPAAPAASPLAVPAAVSPVAPLGPAAAKPPTPTPTRRAVPARRVNRAVIVAAVAVLLVAGFALQVAFSSTGISHDPPAQARPHATHAAPRPPQR